MKFDRQEILRHADSRDIAQTLGIEMRKSGRYWQIKCPGHPKRLGKVDRKFGSAWLTDHGYYCAACGKAVNVIDMTMEASGKTYPEALEFLSKLTGVGRISGEEKHQNGKRYLTAGEIKLLGIKPFEASSSSVFLTDPSTLKHDAEFIKYNRLLENRRRLLAQKSSRERKDLQSARMNYTETFKSTTWDIPRDIPDVLKYEVAMRKMYDGFTTEQREHWKILEKNDAERKSYIKEVQDFLDLEVAPELLDKIPVKTQDGWVTGYTVTRSCDSLRKLYDEDFEEFKRTVICFARKANEAYAQILGHFILPSNMVELLNERIKKVDAIIKYYNSHL